jgi:ketosteroid isomerase-like protein
MEKSVIVTLIVGVLTVTLMCGCMSETVGRGPSDEELINQMLSKWKAAILAQDIDMLMALHSESFKSFEAPDKESQEAVMQNYFDAGYLDDAKVGLESAEIAIEGDKAKVTGVVLDVTVGEGRYPLTFGLQKEIGAWMIIDFEY